MVTRALGPDPAARDLVDPAGEPLELLLCRLWDQTARRAGEHGR